MEVCNNRGHLIWTQNVRSYDARKGAQKQTTAQKTLPGKAHSAAGKAQSRAQEWHREKHTCCQNQVKNSTRDSKFLKLRLRVVYSEEKTSLVFPCCCIAESGSCQSWRPSAKSFSLLSDDKKRLLDSTKKRPRPLSIGVAAKHIRAFSMQGYLC